MVPCPTKRYTTQFCPTLDTHFIFAYLLLTQPREFGFTLPVIQVDSTLYHIFFSSGYAEWITEYRIMFRVRAIAVIWSLWLYRNNKVFNDKNCSLMQVIYRATARLRSWSRLQRVGHLDLFMEVCTRLENTARDFLSQHGWQHNLRIGPPSP